MNLRFLLKDVNGRKTPYNCCVLYSFPQVKAICHVVWEFLVDYSFDWENIHPSSEIVSSPKSASLASNAVKLENNRKAVIALLANHGFSQSQICDLVKRYPKILSANPERTVLPKLLITRLFLRIDEAYNHCMIRILIWLLS